MDKFDNGPNADRESIMTDASTCFTTTAFTPADGSLLSLGEWQHLQTFIISACNLDPSRLPNLNASGEARPRELLDREVAVLNALKCDAIAFHGNVLPLVQSMGANLYNYGSTAHQTFRGVIQLLDAPAPDRAAILQLLQNLEARAGVYAVGAGAIADEVAGYLDRLDTVVSELKAVLAEEQAAVAGEQAEIQNLTLRHQSLTSDMQSAQAAILGDRQTIDEAKYYAWVPFVGAIVAIAKISSANDDIERERRRIAQDVADIQAIQQRLQQLNAAIAELNYVAAFNASLLPMLVEAQPGLQRIRSAWETISSELQDVILNIEQAESAALSDQPCLAAVVLSTAAQEWQDVANDAHSFMANFYLRPQAA